jgi:hypothetical protein
MCLAANTMWLELGSYVYDHLHELSLSICTVMENVLERVYTEKLNIIFFPIGYNFVQVRIKEKPASASVLLPCACDSY